MPKTKIKEIEKIKNRVGEKRDELLELYNELNDILQAINACTDYLQIGLGYIQDAIDELSQQV